MRDPLILSHKEVRAAFGIEALNSNRMAPSFVLPGGFAGQAETDHLDFLQVGWTHLAPAASVLGVVEVRYGYSVAHLDTSTVSTGQSRSELLGGAVTGAAACESGCSPAPGGRSSVAARFTALSGNSLSDRCRWRVENVRAAQPFHNSFRYEPDHRQWGTCVPDGVQHSNRFP
jgi:hypothetical protein